MKVREAGPVGMGWGRLGREPENWGGRGGAWILEPSCLGPSQQPLGTSLAGVIVPY